jgi:nicotinamide/nicotinate riboside kinase
MDEFVKAMQYIRSHDGEFPPTLDSIQDKNTLGHSGVPDAVVKIMQDEVVKENLVNRNDTELLLCLVDGFLLYSDLAVVKELDIRLLVRAPYDKLKARREARSGYVTIEGIPHHIRLTKGFWQDPPEYFDKIVWKSYIKDHQHLFHDNDINGPLREDKILNIQTPIQADLNMQELLMWAMGLISNYLQNIE